MVAKYRAQKVFFDFFGRDKISYHHNQTSMMLSNGKDYSSGFILSQNSVSVKLLLLFVNTIFIIVFASSMNS